MTEYTRIPKEMWDELAAQDAKTSELIGTSLRIQRLSVIRIGKKYGLTEEQLQQSGLIATPPPPRAGALKGSRREQ
ncbi:MAG: hypothetical protein WAN65_00350 [Candidatus Sulfotelmatobacter sp.]